MNKKDQWLQGLQWGACGWLFWVACNAVFHVAGCSLDLEPGFAAALGWSTPRWLHAVVWIAALLLTWTRWSRRAIAIAIGVQAALGTIDAMTCDAGDLHMGDIFVMPFDWTLRYWLPMSVPLLPLLFMEPERPRHTLALLMVGRWRDAIRQLKGWRWILVASSVMLVNRVLWLASDRLNSVPTGSTPAWIAGLLLIVAAGPPSWSRGPSAGP